MNGERTAERAVPGAVMAEDGCPLCGAGTQGAGDRCVECSYPLTGTGEGSRILTPSAWRWSLMGVVITYVVTLAVVAITN